MIKNIKRLGVRSLLSLSVALLATLAVPAYVYAAAQPCGQSPNPVYTPSINIGCKGVGNPITDATFAIIRVLSDGVGLVVIGSIIVGGIQYTASRGDPQATTHAIGRIRSALVALLIYIFGYAILNYIIPAGFLHQ
jgi:hypothetical protein